VPAATEGDRKYLFLKKQCDQSLIDIV